MSTFCQNKKNEEKSSWKKQITRQRQSVSNSWSPIWKPSCTIQFQFWWYFSLDDKSVQWHFGSSDISVLMVFRFGRYFSFGDIWVLGRMWQILLKTEYESRILFGFKISPNTKYKMLFGIEKIWIPKTNSSIWIFRICITVLRY